MSRHRLTLTAVGEDGATWVECDPEYMGRTLVITPQLARLVGLSETRRSVIVDRAGLDHHFYDVIGVIP